ncbi:MAG: Sensor histidine kinase RcsC [Anaerolineae bacterium]|nr:Sensor histidine kinase RcsC [Anaerolineae bacterium]
MPWPRVSKIYLQFLLALTLIAVIPLALIGLGIATLDRSALAERSSRELTSIASAITGELNIKLTGLLRDTDIIASLPSIVSMEPARQNQVLKELFLHNDQFNALDIVDTAGRLTASSHPDRQPIIDAATFYTVATQGRQQWLITSDPNSGQRILLIYAPIRNPQREVIGVVAGAVNLRDLSAVVRKVQIGAGQAFVLDSKGYVLLHPNSEVMQQAGTGPWQAAFNRNELVGSGTTAYQIDGELFDAGYASLVEFGWTVVVERSHTEVIAPAQRSYYLALVAVLLTGALAFGTALWLAGRLTRPVRKLAEAAHAFAAGDASAPLPPLSPSEGEIGILVAAFQEMRQVVSEREEALRQSEQRLALHVQQTPLAVIELSLDMHVVEWNPAAEKIFGYTRQETIGRPVTDLILPEHVHLHLEDLRQALLERRDGLRSTNENLTKSGETIVCEWYNTPLVDPDGQVIAFASLVQDITERIRTEEQLRLMQSVVSNATESVVITEARPINTPGPRILYVNEAFTRLTGYSAEEVAGQTPRILQGPRTNRAELARIRHALENWQPVAAELVNYRKDGSEFWVEFTITPLKDDKGWVTHWVSVQRDVTARKQTAEELERTRTALVAERALLARRVAERTAELSSANAELARAAKLKDEFLASMSHELRTPLNAILGMSESLSEQVYGPLNEDQLDSVHEISTSGHHLLELINDILDLSKIEAGKMELTLEPVSLQGVYQASLRMIKQAAFAKELKVVSTLDQSVGAIWADERRLKQILVNLLSNAVKFTPAGGRIGLDVVSDEAAEEVKFTVWDTGIGIAPEHMTRLFKPFVQLDSRLSRRFEGTGLGLALVYRLVEMHGGSVSAESQVGQGSRFTVSLPWSPATPADGQPGADEPAASFVPAAAAATPPETGPVILLAEDNETNIKTFSRYLQSKGYHIIVARNGVEAVDRARESAPTLIIMDIQMPEMDGLEAIRRLRANARFAATPIVALTALAMPGDRERCLAAGASYYLSKPISLKQLLHVIETHLRTPEEA